MILSPAGYNNFEVAEFLLEMGADVNAQDKGGLIPLHNASSYGHLDIAALLLKHNTIVNATDKWGFTPLHEGITTTRSISPYEIPNQILFSLQSNTQLHKRDERNYVHYYWPMVLMHS